MARKQILPHNIRVDRNCQPTWVTQNAIPGEQELIPLGGGGYDPPDKVGLIAAKSKNKKIVDLLHLTKKHNIHISLKAGGHVS